MRICRPPYAPIQAARLFPPFAVIATFALSVSASGQAVSFGGSASISSNSSELDDGRETINTSTPPYRRTANRLVDEVPMLHDAQDQNSRQRLNLIGSPTMPSRLHRRRHGQCLHAARWGVLTGRIAGSAPTLTLKKNPPCAPNSRHGGSGVILSMCRPDRKQS
jgi:hypothetical protein